MTQNPVTGGGAGGGAWGGLNTGRPGAPAPINRGGVGRESWRPYSGDISIEFMMRTPMGSEVPGRMGRGFRVPDARGGLAQHKMPSWMRRALMAAADVGEDALRALWESLWGVDDAPWVSGPVYGHQNFTFEETCPEQFGCGTVSAQWTSVPPGVFTPCGAGCVGSGLWFDTFAEAAADPSGTAVGSRVFNSWQRNTVGFFASPKEKWIRTGLGPAPDLRFSYRLAPEVLQWPWQDPLTRPRALAQPNPWADPDGRPWAQPSALPATEFKRGRGGDDPPTRTYHRQGPGDKALKRKVPFGFFAALRLFHTATEVCDFFAAVAKGLQGVRVHRSALGEGTAQTGKGCVANIAYAVDNLWKLEGDDGTILANILWNIGENAVEDRALGKLLGARWGGQEGIHSGSYGEGAYADAAYGALSSMESF